LTGAGDRYKLFAAMVLRAFFAARAAALGANILPT
jgi:hypothetical protein